ncbi:MAG: YIP1 family protein [Acidobacteriota bacterium]|nr:YIP1 family protein [Acidobacteriota bacterium]
MSEENSNLNEPNQSEWQAPPLPEEIRNTDEPARMSEVATLGNIFISPGETFEDLRRKPRFIMAVLVMIFLATAFQFLFTQKLGEDRMRSFMVEQMDKSPMTQSLAPEQKQQAIERGLKIASITKYLIPVFLLIAFAIGGLLYWLGGKAMGGTGNFLHGLSAWVYSSFPPLVVAMLANFLILMLKSVDEIDIGNSQRGLIHANPSFFMDGKSMPVLATILGTLDFFQIWGWILAAIGLQKLMKLSKGSAWAIVLIITLIFLAFRVISAFFNGNPV